MDEIIRSKAPLRISFAGGGTDVPPYPEMYGGAVISTTIDRYAYVTIKKNDSKGIRVISQDFGLIEKIESISSLKISGKTSLIKAALIESGLKKDNIDIIIHADSPPGSGLGSSSAVSVALVGCLERYLNENLSSYQIAERAIKLERELLRISGGYQDQYASSFGGFNFIEFNKSVIVNPIRLNSSIVNELLASLILVDTGMIRLSGKILKKQIKKYENKDPEALQHLSEIKKLAYEMKALLLKGNIKEIGYSLDSYWEHKKRIDKSISNSTINTLYKKIKKSGAIGGKILGAGGGGHMLFLCEPEKKSLIVDNIKKIKAVDVKFNFDDVGLQTWILRDGVVVY